jgi:hypothetical protein
MNNFLLSFLLFFIIFELTAMENIETAERIALEALIQLGEVPKMITPLSISTKNSEGNNRCLLQRSEKLQTLLKLTCNTQGGHICPRCKTLYNEGVFEEHYVSHLEKPAGNVTFEYYIESNLLHDLLWQEAARNFKSLRAGVSHS